MSKNGPITVIAECNFLSYFNTYLRSYGLISGLFFSHLLFADDGPWRLNDYIYLSDNFSLSGQHRIRYETLDEQFRVSSNGGDQILVFRTNVLAELKLSKVNFTAELMDSRAKLADAGTTINTSVVNPLELLQVYIEYTEDDLFSPGSKSRIRGGRFAMNVGSRRLITRNGFRNTINAFTGIDWQWTSADNDRFRFFYTLPIQRLVDGSPLDHEPKMDKEHKEIRFWGLYYSPSQLPWGNNGEIYFFGLDEKDVPGRTTLDRELYTTGFRIFRNPEINQFYFQFESVFQFGKSRTSRSSTVDLDHFAHFQHIEIGYTFNAPMSPQLLFQYDYASGDADPSDDDNNRFDTLFGARRFEFGPTGIYGPFRRSNISTPGIRLKFKPGTNMTSFLALRSYWLASSDDVWPVARLANPPGVSVSYIGTQIEARFR